MKHHFCALILALGLAGCAAESIEGGVIEPSFDDKSDFFANLSESGAIAFGESASGTFDEDFQFFAYRFRAAEGAELTATVTHRGSSSSLDTTMFLYRMNRGAQPTRIAVDDDSGWGALSKIGGFELYSEAEYAVVLGTKDAAGRGNYNFELTCDNGACEVAVLEPACPLTSQATITECVDEVSAEWGYEAELNEILSEACATSEAIVDIGVDVDDADACQAWSGRAYPPTTGRTVGFLQPASEAAIDALVEQVNNSPECSSGEDYGCEFAFRAYEYDTDSSITIEELMAHARLSTPPGPGVFAQQQSGDAAAEAFEDLNRSLDIASEVTDIVELLGGHFPDAEYGSFGGSDIAWNYGDCGGLTVVVNFADQGLAIEISEFYCSG